jgi:hypothetical protein
MTKACQIMATFLFHLVLGCLGSLKKYLILLKKVLVFTIYDNMQVESGV